MIWTFFFLTQTDSENEKERRSDVKSSKLAKLKRRSKQSGRKATKMAKKRTKKATSEALSVGSSSKEAGDRQMVDGPDELSGLHLVSDGDGSIPSPSTSSSGLGLSFHSQFDPEEHEGQPSGCKRAVSSAHQPSPCGAVLQVLACIMESSLN